MAKSLEEKIKENHIIFIHSDMSAKDTNDAILDIMLWNKASKDIEINIYLSSSDWNFVNTMAIYDVLKSVENPIAVYCMGEVGYYSVVFLAAASKGKRYALKHTEICLKQPYGRLTGGPNQQTEVDIEYKKISSERRVFEEIMAAHLNKPIEEIHQLVESDKEFKADEAKEYGLIDLVLE